MKIIEVRDGFIKFETDKSIYLSSFIHIKGMEKIYIAQVTKLNSFGEQSVAVAKMLFLFENHELKAYDKTEPPKDSEIKDFTFEILNNSIKFNDPVIIGKTVNNSFNITIDASAFDKKMMICADSKNANNILVRNLTKQFLNLKKKVIIIDTLGILNGKKHIAGKDFKLPLDKFSLDFLYESCLNDATAESKKTIIELFNELKEYSEAVEFVPFDVLKNIVDNMVDKEHLFKLLVLKNKLSKYASLGYFASKSEEVNVLNQIMNSDTAILDLSQLDILFQNRYLSYIFSKLSKLNNIQVFLEAANTVSKTNLKTAISDENISTTFITHSKFKYLNDIKNMFDNFIIEPSITANEAFRIYDNFLKVMKPNSCLITGEATNYIPIITNIQLIDDVTEIKKAVNLPELSGGGSLTTVEEPEIIENNNSEDTAEPEDIENTEEEIIEEVDLNEEQESIAQDDVEPDSESDSDFEEEEPEELPPTQEEIISTIDKKSEDAIAKVTEELEQPEDMNLFSNEDNNDDEPEEVSPDDSEETISEQEDEPEAKYDTEYYETEDNLYEDISLENKEDDEQPDEELEFEEYDPSQDRQPYEDVEDEDAVFDKELEIVEYDSEKDNKDYSDETAEFYDNSLTDISQEENGDLYSEEDIEDDSLLTADNDELNDELDNSDEQDVIDETELTDYQTEEIDEFETTDNQTEGINELVEDEDTEEQSLINPDSDNLIEIENSDLELDDYETKEHQQEQQKLAEIEEQLVQPAVLPVSNSADDSEDFSEIVELDPSDADENDIVIDMNEENNNEVIDEEVERKIMEDVDKVYTTLKNDNNQEAEASTGEDYSESDLDLIDELNSEDTEILENGSEGEFEGLPEGDGILDDKPSKESIESFNSEILEKKDSTTPIVPVYDASIPNEDIVMSDPIEQGDNVYHAKYGNGVVEKMIKYGSKSLYSINFENIGRRLLDPTLTEIKKA